MTDERTAPTQPVWPHPDARRQNAEINRRRLDEARRLQRETDERLARLLGGRG
jgi:hypothetical protein